MKTQTVDHKWPSVDTPYSVFRTHNEITRAYAVAPNYLKQAAKTSWSCHATGPFACYPRFPTAWVSVELAAVWSILWHDIQTPHLRARFTTLLHSSILALQCKVHPLTTTYIQNISPVVLLRVDIDRQQLRRLCLGPQPFSGKSALGHHSIYSRPPKPQPNICFFGLCVISGIPRYPGNSWHSYCGPTIVLSSM